MTMMQSKAGWFVVFSALGLAVLGSVGSASGSTGTPPAPWAICDGASVADLGVLETSLSPANGATVPAGTPVIFTGHSESTPTFALASSPALLSSPDIDSGFGSAQPQPSSSGPPVVNSYTFTSTKATATLGTIYWNVSFSNANIAECAGQSPATYTTAVRTLTVLSPSTEEAGGKQKQEEAATTGSASSEESTIAVQPSGKAAVKLVCTGAATCSGRLILTVKSTKGDGSRRGEKASNFTTTIGSARFSISAAKTTLVKLTLNVTGRALLKADRGRLSTTLTILESSPGSSKTQAESVRLVSQKAAKAKQP
jgi:hypothetical protein